MGEHAESLHRNYSTALTVGEDMSVAKDIAKRFEQLESQWLHFQKKSGKWEGEARSAAQPTLSDNFELDRTVPSTAFSYSNPLFSNHKTGKRRSAGNSPRVLTSARSSVTFLTSYSPDKVLSTRHRQRFPMLTGSERHGPVFKEKFLCAASTTPSQPASPLSSSLSSRITKSQTEKCPGPRSYETPQVTGPLTPPNFSPVKTTAYSLNPMWEPPSKASDSSSPISTVNIPVKTLSYSPNCITPSKPSTSLSPLSTVNSERQLRPSFLLESHPDNRSRSNPDSTCDSKLPIRECTKSMWSSLSSGAFTSSKPPTTDPATYSSGKGPPGLQIPRVTEEIGSVEVAQSSRSPPPVTPSASSARDTDLHSESSTIEPRSNPRGCQPRNLPQQMLAELRILSEDNNKIYPSQIPLEDKRGVTERSIGLATTPDLCSPGLTSGKLFKSDTQLDWMDRKEISALVQHKLDHTVSKVEWELRLSKRESKLRIAEESLLEEQQKLSEARLAVSKCEDVLSQREEAVNHLEQKRDLEATLESVETGTMVMGKLVAALRDVLAQMERKERGLNELWSEFKQSCQQLELGEDHQFGFEPNQARGMVPSMDLGGIHLLAATGDCKEWCKIVIHVCERLVDFLARETHLQKWAAILERESLRMKSLEEEIIKSKETTAEQFERAAEMMRCAEEQTRMAEEERTTLSKERESLVLWVSHLQERRKAVTECEREAASSLAEVQKKAANLFVHESSIDGKALEISALQEELWATSMRLHDDQELVNKERLKVQEKLRHISVRERDADSQFQGLKRLKEDLEAQQEQSDRDRIADEKRRERAHNAQRDIEARLDTRETTLREIERELEEKALAAESLAAQLNEREKILKSMHEHCEVERLKMKESISDLEKEKKRVKESKESIEEAQVSKKNAEESWARVSKERREADDYLKSVEERVKAWEDRLRVKEKELQQQQFSLREIETRIQEEQDRSQSFHAKLILEQETWTEELKAKQESLAKRTKILENKESEIKSDLDKLTEERKLAINEIKRFAEMEARAWAAERELQTRHDEHALEMRKHAKDYRAQVDELEAARREVEREFEEVHTKRDELQIWQREAEQTLQTRIESFVKGKEELQMQIQELKKLQLDIEQAGAKIIDRVAELDQASSKLENQRSKVELSKGKLESLARNLGQQQELVKGRENTLAAQEEQIASALSDVKRMTAETAAKEKNVRLRELAVNDNERDLQELEARLATERRDLENMISEVERHAATLKEETASAEEISRERSCEEQLVEEKRNDNLAKEKELIAFETSLKTKALSLEEHSQALAKLEQQLQERLHRSQDIEAGWEKLREEQSAFESQREALANQKEDAQQWKAEQDRKAKEDAQRKARLREELDRQKTEMLSKLREREHAVHLRESKLAEKEASIEILERQGKSLIHKDAQELRSQLNGAREELDAQRQYVEEKRRVAEAIAATIEEREAKLISKEKEVEKREASLEGRDKTKGHKRPLVDLPLYSVDYCRLNNVQDICHSQMPSREKVFRDESLYQMAQREQRNDPQETSSLEEISLERGRHNTATKQEDDVANHRLKQMEDVLQKEASKIMQERANLKVQQKELEETRKAVQDVKVTLTAQLKATKQMVADAALTAQNASREREALEEERKRLEKAQKETEISLAEKEAKLVNETKHLENMRSSLFVEKTQAMEVLQKAARVVEKERVKAMETNVLQREKKVEAEFMEREKELSKTADLLHKEKAALQGEKAKLKKLRGALERGKHEQRQLAFKQAVATEGKREPESRQFWNGSSPWTVEKKLGDLHNYQHLSHTCNRDVHNPESSQQCNVPLYKEGLHNPHIGTSSERFGRNQLEFRTDPHTDRMGESGINETNASWDDLFNSSTVLSSPESSMGVGLQVNPGPLERRVRGTCDRLQETTPSKKRLDNVMMTLLNARQASKSRLQRTERALLGLSPASTMTTQVQQALNALSGRLNLMEQIEDGLASQLRKAYEIDYPESEGVIVDKVQLLCRMEEQQSLRAEWEEDMQKQLETIGMLQTSSQNMSSFTTPVKGGSPMDKFQSPMSHHDWQGAASGDARQGKSDGAQNLGSKGDSGTTMTNSGSMCSNPSQQFQSPVEWKTTFEPLLGVDATGLSFSPLVDYNYYSNAGSNSHVEYMGRETDGVEKFARRKLQLSPSIAGCYGAQ